MRMLARLFACSALLGLFGCALTPSNHNAYAPLILISIDGYRADYLQRGLSPTLAALAADGVHAEAMRPAFPSLTFPNHYTLVTGLTPDHHGIVNNRMLDPVTGAQFVYKDKQSTADPHWWGGEPVWVSVEKHGGHAATMYWPGSDVAIEGVRPSAWREFDGKVSPSQRVAQILAWIDQPAAQRPQFLTLYFEQVDHAGHTYGPDASEVDAEISVIDSALAELVAGLKQRGLERSANIVVVSDHGMTSSGSDRAQALDDVIDVRHVTIDNSGVLAGLAAKPGFETEIEQALLKPQEHMQCWKKSAVPARLHYGNNARIPPLLCLAAEGWVIGTREAINDPKRHFSLGEHGYDNDLPSMRALFVAHGPAFRHGVTLPEFDNVDVYPMLMRVLGLQPQPNDGSIATLRRVLIRP